MWQDPIVEEIHQIRQQLAAQCGNDLSKIVERAMQHQHERAATQPVVVAPLQAPAVGALHKTA